jgi:hypothetical protein
VGSSRSYPRDGPGPSAKHSVRPADPTAIYLGIRLRAHPDVMLATPLTTARSPGWLTSDEAHTAAAAGVTIQPATHALATLIRSSPRPGPHPRPRPRPHRTTHPQAVAAPGQPRCRHHVRDPPLTTLGITPPMNRTLRENAGALGGQQTVKEDRKAAGECRWKRLGGPPFHHASMTVVSVPTLVGCCPSAADTS